MSDAKSVMTPDPYLLGSGSSILDAVEVFNLKSFTSTPVVTPLGEVLGQITDMDLMKALVHQKSQGSKYSKVIHAKDYFHPVFFVDEYEALTSVIRVMSQSSTHRVLVQNKNKKIVGIISPKDILHRLHKTENSNKSLFEELQILYKENESLKERLQEMGNDKLHEALGYEPGELINKTIFDLYPPTFHKEAAAGLKKVMADGRHILTYSSMVKKDGTMIRVDLASASLRDENGRFLGTFTISRQYGSEAMLRSLHGVFEDKDER